MSHFYILECKAEGCEAEFFLNGVPVLTRGAPRWGAFTGVPVNPLVVDGENSLEVVVRPGDVPSESRTGPFGPKQLVPCKDEFVQAKLVRYPIGAVVGGPDGFEL